MHGAARWGRESLGEVRSPIRPRPRPRRLRLIHGKAIPHLGLRCFPQSTNLTSTSTSDLLATHRQSSPPSIHSQSLPHRVPAPSTPPPGIHHLPARLAHGLQHPSPANPDPAQPASQRHRFWPAILARQRTARQKRTGATFYQLRAATAPT
jgi:hypothetical protein